MEAIASPVRHHPQLPLHPPTLHPEQLSPLKKRRRTTKQKKGAGGSGAGGGGGGNSDRNILKVVLGDVLFDTWYGSFYPEELVGGDKSEVDRLYVCRWCFRYSKELMPYVAHVNLSLFAKLFLDNKSVCFDLTAFKYYLLVQHAESQPDSTASRGGMAAHQVVGFFSKEKMSWDNNNLACILVFPPWQRRGLGKILMGVSYELSKREGRIGGPEKRSLKATIPAMLSMMADLLRVALSDLGKRGYTSFWCTTVARYILSSPLRKTITVKSISENTFVLPDDIIAALKEMSVLNPKKRAADTAVVNKAKVKEWAQSNGVDVAPVVDPAGFFEESMPDSDDEIEA
ncbi:MAG: hypothetical protein M1837_006245 [Sclerophora amabilis]|nr:MAG: hypothetical protein M1837_006245 [Sclerophora amabilis]